MTTGISMEGSQQRHHDHDNFSSQPSRKHASYNAITSLNSGRTSGITYKMPKCQNSTILPKGISMGDSYWRTYDHSCLQLWQWSLTFVLFIDFEIKSKQPSIHPSLSRWIGCILQRICSFDKLLSFVPLTNNQSPATANTNNTTAGNANRLTQQQQTLLPTDSNASHPKLTHRFLEDWDTFYKEFATLASFFLLHQEINNQNPTTTKANNNTNKDANQIQQQ